MRWRRCCASRRPVAPAAAHAGLGRQSQARLQRAAAPVRSAAPRPRSRSRAPAAACDRGSRAHDGAPVARHARADRIPGRIRRGARQRHPPPDDDPLEGRGGDLRARRRRRAADRRAHFVPARRHSRVPVGYPDEEIRRGDLRRRLDRLVDAARTRCADDCDPARGTLGSGIRGGNRHDARQPGSGRAGDDGPRSRALSGHDARDRRGADDAAAHVVRRPGGPARGRFHDAVVLDPVRDLRARGRGYRSTSRTSWRASSSRSCSRS